jgi:hypothetical protein
MHRLTWSLILVAPALWISGCGPSEGIWVEGKLTKGAEKYTVPPDQRLTIIFYSMEPVATKEGTTPAGQPYTAVYNPDDATFTVLAPSGSGVPPGKYRVTLTQKLTREAVDKKNEKLARNQMPFERDTDMLKGQFGDDSQIVVDIKDSTEVTIDIDKHVALTESRPGKRNASEAARVSRSRR